MLRQFKRHLLTMLRRMAARFPAFLHNFDQWETLGYHITPVHFYQPIPDTRELRQRYPARSRLTGIEWQPEKQRELLRAIAAFAGEAAFDRVATAPDRFYTGNEMFNGIDPYVYYGVIRHFCPQQIIEVGAGFSTLVAAQAARMNGATSVTAVEPYPRDFIREGALGIRHIASRAEDLDITFFDSLGKNDILFIDSSHVVRTGSDVLYLLLEVLPRLRDGVIVHIHDIFLPDDYPPEWTLKKHIFWTEQYLVQALLIHNQRVEVLLGNHFLTRDFPEEARQLFPDAPRWTGGSLWLRIGRA